MNLRGRVKLKMKKKSKYQKIVKFVMKPRLTQTQCKLLRSEAFKNVVISIIIISFNNIFEL